MKELHELNRRVAALEERANGGALAVVPATTVADLGEFAGRIGEAERSIGQLMQAQADALPPGQVKARLDWLKDHADGTDEAGKMVLERLDDVVGKIEAIEKRLAAIEAKPKGRANG